MKREKRRKIGEREDDDKNGEWENMEKERKTTKIENGRIWRKRGRRQKLRMREYGEREEDDKNGEREKGLE